MNASMNEKPRWRIATGRPFPLLGLVLVISFLTHDIGMAGDLHVAAVDDHHAAFSEFSSFHATARSGAHGDDAATCVEDDCSPPVNCDVARGAVFAQDSGRPDPLITSGPANPGFSEDPHPRPHLAPGIEPVLSPATRRALFQVFLI